MKRTLNMFGALAVAAIAFLSAAPAHATNPGPGTYGGVSCSTYSNGSSYPGPDNFLVCAPMTTQTKSGRFGVISGMHSNAKSKLSTLNVRYYLFNSKDDYQAYFQGAGVTPGNPSSPFGFSIVNPGGDSYTVVFLQGAGSVDWHLDIVDETLAHETGHHLDKFWGPTPFGTTFASSSTAFNDLLKHDQFMLNNKWRSGNRFSKRNPCGAGGALVNLYDGSRGVTTLTNGNLQFGQYVCDGKKLRTSNLGDFPNAGDPGYQAQYDSNTGLLTGRNFAVLKYVMPEWADNLETFANTYAVITGDRHGFIPPYSTQTRMIDAEFSCITALVQRLYTHNTEPPNGYTYNCERPFPPGSAEIPDDEE